MATSRLQGFPVVDREFVLMGLEALIREYRLVGDTVHNDRHFALSDFYEGRVLRVTRLRDELREEISRDFEDRVRAADDAERKAEDAT